MKKIPKQSKSHPGIQVSNTAETKQELLSPEELEYRTMLQEAIFWVTRQVLVERKEEITKRAEARVRTLMELRGA